MSSNPRPPMQEAFTQAAAFFGNTDVPQQDRVSNLLSLLQSSVSQQIRDQLGDPVLQLLRAEEFVPDAYLQWRPLIHDALRYVLSHISNARLAPKLVEQFELPAGTPSEIRLLRFIGKMPGFQKLGQVLARNRNLSPWLRAALTKLENSIRDANATEIQSIIAEELGLRLDSYSVDIDADLLSEATVSAVVRFTWRNPRSSRTERGVFKVMKPYVSGCFAEDMELLQELAEYLESRHTQYGIAANVLAETFSEVRRLLEHEVDFAREQATLLEVASLYGSMPGVRTPRLIPQLCARRVTAMSEERGTKITEGAAKLPPWQQQRVAARLIECLVAVPLFANQGNTTFHADPHAGNLLYDKRTDSIVVLDWALTERLNESQRRHISLLLIMFGLRDPAGMYDAVQSLSEFMADAEQERIIRDCIHEALAQVRWKALPGLMDLTRLLDRLALLGVPFPSSLLMFRKVLFTLDGILHEIAGPQFSMELALSRYVMARWMVNWPAAAPLAASDWLSVQWSALSYASRLFSLAPIR